MKITTLGGAGTLGSCIAYTLGVPVTLGKKGIDRIIELDLTPEERRDLDHSVKELTKKAHLVKEVIDKSKP
jgi:malate/lactate dehydrogenase